MIIIIGGTEDVVGFAADLRNVLFNGGMGNNRLVSVMNVHGNAAYFEAGDNGNFVAITAQQAAMSAEDRHLIIVSKFESTDVEPTDQPRDILSANALNGIIRTVLPRYEAQFDRVVRIIAFSMEQFEGDQALADEISQLNDLLLFATDEPVEPVALAPRFLPLDANGIPTLDTTVEELLAMPPNPLAWGGLDPGSAPPTPEPDPEGIANDQNEMQ